jgi:ATP-binding cassette subfamily B protein
MNEKRITNKLKAAVWGIKLAWKIDKKMLLRWTGLSFGLAILPAVALYFNRSIIAELSAFLVSGQGQFADVAFNIIILGVILTVSGLSARLNDDLFYMMMFDSYYLGLEETMMDAAQQIEMNELLKKEINDEYYAVISRCGSLTDLTSSGCALLTKLFTIGSLMAVALTVSSVIFVVTLVYVAGVVWLNGALSDKARVVWSEEREHLRRAEYFEKLSQSGDTAKETRIFESAAKIKNYWQNAYGKVEAMELRQTAAYTRLNFFTSAGFYLFTALTLTYSVLSVASGAMGPDILLMVYMMCTSIAANIEGIARSYQRMDYGLYGLDIQRRFFEDTPKINAAQNLTKAGEPLDEKVIFSAENLYFSYCQNAPVLKNLTFQIHKGETVALVGANGSGKTTLVKVLLGLLYPLSGQAKFMGRAHADYRMGFVSSRIGSFFQDFYLFHLTLGENVGIGNIDYVDREDRILTAMEKGGARQLPGKLSKGLHTLLGRQVYKDGAVLSGGEGQRVAVSRAHMCDKEVLIFDEPASMLDPIAEMEQFHHIKERLEGRTAILISHRIGFARLADRILVLANGELVEDGSHEELMRKDGVYAKLFSEQAQWYNIENVDSAKGGALL